MRHALATVLLGPLLLLQGRHVRRVTPTLPEPPGDRRGITGTGPELRLLILGDSAAAGVGASHQSEALLGQLVSALTQDFCVHWTLHACTGHTTQQALEHLAQLPPQPFDMVVTSVGVNDATAGTGTRRWQQHMTELLHMLETRHEAGHILVSGLPPMHRFPALPQPLRWYMGLRAAALNRALQELLAGNPRRRLVQVEFSGDAGLMASDGFHPGPGAYAEWGRVVADTVQKQLMKAVHHQEAHP
jgi:lysophospholipase L1-like esterase